MEFKYTENVKEVLISRHLITHVSPHPEGFDGGFMASLDNTMWTDAFKVSDEVYYTSTNDKQLIDYLESQNKAYQDLKKYVKLLSITNINVEGGICFLDCPKSIKRNNKWKFFKPKWEREIINISKGTFWYPAYISKWMTVESLISKGEIKLLEFSNELPEILIKKEV